MIIIAYILTACSTSRIAIKNQQPIAANYNVQLSIAYLEQGEVTQSKQKLLLAMQQAPIASRFKCISFFWESTGEIERTESYYKQALKIASYSGAVLNNYGAFLCRNKQYMAAEKQFIYAMHDANYVNVEKAYENAGLCALKMQGYYKITRKCNCFIRNGQT